MILNNAVCEGISKHRELYSASVREKESFTVAQTDFIFEMFPLPSTQNGTS